MKKHIYELAKEIGLPAKKLIEELKELGITVQSHMSTLSKEDYELVKNLYLEEKSKKEPIKVSEGITVGNLAKKVNLNPSELIQKLIKAGIMANINQSLSKKEIETVGKELGIDISILKEEIVPEIKEKEKKEKAGKATRAPVVVVLGHVDHGKTTLLDTIRKTNIVEKEKGKITQHIGASSVELKDGHKIIFLDTPGHEAFTSLRVRGSKITDIAVLVVAADDGVQPQTKEAIDHARAAEIPIVVAINKIDAKTANIEKVKTQLQSLGLVPEEAGGTTQFVNVSALKNIGIDKLLEAILLETEMLEITTKAEGPAVGHIIENRMDKGRGPVGTLLIESGTLKIGDYFVSGNTFGKVRGMIDDLGRNVKEAPPSSVVEVAAFSSLPISGDYFQVMDNEKEVKRIVSQRNEKQKSEKMKERAVFTLENLQEQIGQQKKAELRCIIKSDVQGSHEALQQALEKLNTEEVKLNIIHQGVGGINSSDVLLAEASQAIIIGFNVGLQGAVQRSAKERGVEIRLYDVIYDVIDDIKKAMEGMLAPKFEEVLIGKAEVKKVFPTTRKKIAAGVQVTEGKIARSAKIHVLREQEKLYEGKLDSLRRFKDNVNEVKEGQECGISVSDFQDFQPGDIVEVYTLRKSK
jgi:translation initiation factor IF-2